MKAPLFPMRLLQAFRLLSAILVCVLALFSGAATARTHAPCPIVQQLDAASTSRQSAIPVLSSDRPAIDLDDLFEHAAAGSDSLSTAVTVPAQRFRRTANLVPRAIDGALPERPPRD